MHKAMMFVGTAGFVISLLELLPEGKWIYLGLLIFSTALVALCAADVDKEDVEHAKKHDEPKIKSWKNID